MTIKDLYTSIKNKNITHKLIIFLNQKDNDFIANQYIKEIAEQHDLKILAIESLDGISANKSVFDNLFDSGLRVFRVQKFDYLDFDTLFGIEDIIISCYEIPKAVKTLFKDYIVEVPVLTKDQIKDYVYSKLDGMNTNLIDWLCDATNYDIFRLDIEIDRLNLFGADRDTYMETFSNDLIYDDISSKTIYDFIDAIVTRNKSKIKNLYSELHSIEYTPMGFYYNLYNSIRNIVMAQLHPSPSAETCGMSTGQYYYVKRQINKMTKDQLLKAFRIITDIDRKLKTDGFDLDILFDYLVVEIFSL